MRLNHGTLWRAIASAIPDRVALRTGDGEVWSYARFAREAGALAETLRGLGVRPGDTVAMLLYNRAEFLITFFACLATGITPVPLNYRLRAAEVAALLDDCGAAVLVQPSSLAELGAEAIAQTGHPVAVITVADDEGACPGIRWDDAVVGDTPLPAEAPEEAELWIYTGGTTGRPKAVRWNVCDMSEVQAFSAYTMAQRPWPTTLEEAVAIAVDPVYRPMVNLPLAPFMHGTALTTSMNTLTVGGTVLITGSARFDPEVALDLAIDQRATRIIVAGDAVALPLVEAAEARGALLPEVDSVMSSGMRFSPECKARLHALGQLTIFDLLASTEGGGFAVTKTSGVQDLPGRPQLYPTAVVLNDQLEEVQDRPGTLGVLAQRGALPLGYHGDEEKTRETFPIIGGVRHVVPGDWVRVEDDRHIEFLGRGSGVINTGGEKVYPLEVEEALVAHPAVADAVVLGIPDTRFGEIVTAVVERSAPVSADDLMRHVDERLAGYKKPRHITFRDSMDRTPTGKVNLAELRAEVVRDHSEGTPT